MPGTSISHSTRESTGFAGLTVIVYAALKHCCPASSYWVIAKAVDGMAGRLPDPFVVANTKLSQEWSANRVLPHMNEEWLDTVLSDERFAREMDNGVKCRLLLAGLLALNSPTYQDSGIARAQLQESLQRLQQAAKTKDADEWFRITAAAAGRLDGRLHLDAVTQHSAVVQETITALKEQVQQSTNQHLFPPLESKYINSSSANFSLKPNAGHFTLRPHPRVQPLATGVSYAAATPPPAALGAAAAPGLQSPAAQGDHTSANPAWIRQKLQKTDIMRTASLTGVPAAQTAAPAAGAVAEAGGSGGPPSRTKVAKAKTPKLQMLGDDEQEEMNKLIKEQSARKKDKGHGLALRHTENVDHLIPTTITTRVKHEDFNTPATATAAGFRSAGIRLKMNPRGTAAAAAAAAAEGDGGADQPDKLGSAAAAEDDYYENVRDDDDDFIVRGEVDYRMREARQEDVEEAMYGVTGAVERDIDELFEDSGSEDEGDDGRRRGLSGVGRSGRMRHQHEADRDEQTPDELLDDLEAHNEGDMPPSGSSRAAADAVVNVDNTHVNDMPVLTALTAKRRRVVVESDEDDD